MCERIKDFTVRCISYLRYSAMVAMFVCGYDVLIMLPLILRVVNVEHDVRK